MHFGEYGHGWWGLGMGFFWILIFAFGLFCIFFFLRSTYSERKERPMEILKKRYAKGEISKDEYEKVKKDLQE